MAFNSKGNSVYLSVDLETTGLKFGHIIQFGIVLDNLVSPLDMLPRLELLVKPPKMEFYGEAYALWMNHAIIEKIAKGEKATADVDLGITIKDWLRQIGFERKSYLFAGKNFATFDLKFLEAIKFFDYVPMKHRTLDPGSMYWKPSDGDTPPDTNECYRRAGLPTGVAHTAVEDALKVTELIRRRHEIQ